MNGTATVPVPVRYGTAPRHYRDISQLCTVPYYYNSYESRICILKESRRIIKNRYRNDSYYSTKTTYARADRSQGGEATRNQKEKLDRRKIRTTAVSRTICEIPFGIDKTVRFLAWGGVCG